MVKIEYILLLQQPKLEMGGAWLYFGLCVIFPQFSDLYIAELWIPSEFELKKSVHINLNITSPFNWKYTYWNMLIVWRTRWELLQFWVHSFANSVVPAGYIIPPYTNKYYNDEVTTYCFFILWDYTFYRHFVSLL